MALGMISLVIGVWIGLQRIGWTLPLLNVNWIFIHGPLMVCGFLGTVIGLERAVVQNKMFFYTGPLFTGLGAFVLLFNLQPLLGYLFFMTGSIVLVINYAVVLKKFPTMHLAIMGLGAVLFFGGNILWSAGFPLPNIVSWWAGFLVLTIAGERLELSRILQPSKKVKTYFSLIIMIYMIGIIFSTSNYSSGMKVSGLAMILLSVWLLKNDLAMKSVKIGGQHRFIALALIAGYLWLGIGGILALTISSTQAGSLYDAILHSIFLGFVFSMIMGHAPIIFPAILRVRMNFSKRFYLHLALLHISLITRIIGDIVQFDSSRLWGGIFNGIAILIFLLNTVTSIKKQI